MTQRRIQCRPPRHVRATATDNDTVFDSGTDIHSQKLDAPGRFVLRDNRIVAPAKPRLFLLRSDRPTDISGNTLNSEPVDPPMVQPAP